jgi:PAS domain S-box-containing protein
LETNNAGENPTSDINDQVPIEDTDPSFFYTIPAALLIVDVDGRILRFNQAALELLTAGLTMDLNGRPLADFIAINELMPDAYPAGKIFPAHQKRTVDVILRRLDDQQIPVRMIFTPTEVDTSNTLVYMVHIQNPVKSESYGFRQAYQNQRILNQKLGEILEISRTFSLYLNLERVMNQIVRVVGESLGYGVVGLFMKDERSDRMRVATYTNPNLDMSDLEIPNPGVDWDILTHITRNSSDLLLSGGKRLRINFGDDGYGAGEEPSSRSVVNSSEIWQLDESLLALVRLEGSVTSGFIRVSQPIRKPRTGSLVQIPLGNTEIFCQQALWIFASQAAVAIENAILFEKAQQEINDRKAAEAELASAQEELKNRIHTRTLRLEKANQDLEQEIRKRELTQNALDGQQELLHQVLDTNPTLIYVRDRNGRYTLINEAAARFEGLTVDEITGKVLSDLNHDITQVLRWRHEDLDVLDNQRELILPEERVKDTHGREHYFQTIKRPIISPSGQAEFVLGVSIDVTALKRAKEQAVQANVDLAQAYDATIEGWSRALDFRDHETEGHSKRVKEMTLQLAKAMGLDDHEKENLKRGAWLHDIGKVGIPDNILLKKNPLTIDEWKIMRKHPVIGYEILQDISYLHAALDIPHHHHERWDGSGYPDGLEGEAIPLAARIFAVVDVWDAMTQDRVYRKALSEEEAHRYIAENSGKHFDPKVVNVFINNLGDIVARN